VASETTYTNIKLLCVILSHSTIILGNFRGGGGIASQGVGGIPGCPPLCVNPCKALMAWPNIQIEERSNVHSTIIVQNPRYSCLEACSHEAKIIKELDISQFGLMIYMYVHV
jgi:hypothetical protein